MSMNDERGLFRYRSKSARAVGMGHAPADDVSTNVMPPIKRILVPTDFGATSDQVLRYAIDLARKYGASIHLLHVMDPMKFASLPDGYFVELPGIKAYLRSEAQKQLVAAAADCTASKVTVTTQVTEGAVADAILEVANVRGCDLIVMGTHGRKGFVHLILGSVAEQVVRIAPCGVVTIRDASAAA